MGCFIIGFGRTVLQRFTGRTCGKVGCEGVNDYKISFIQIFRICEVLSNY